MTDALTINVRLTGFVRKDGKRRWISMCPSLDLVSQGSTKGEAESALREAIEVWVESCVERNTLGPALRELGWRFDGVPPEDADTIKVQKADVQTPGDCFPVEMTIPAYQAALIMSGNHATC